MKIANLVILTTVEYDALCAKLWKLESENYQLRQKLDTRDAILAHYQKEEKWRRKQEPNSEQP